MIPERRKAKMEQEAVKYARETTTVRCDKIGNCDNCSVKHCDYKSRLEAYKAGYMAGYEVGWGDGWSC